MTRADTFVGAGLAIAFLFMLRAATALPYSSEFAPGPGFAPFWLALAGTALSAFIAVRGARAAPGAPFEGAGLVRLGLAAGGLVVATALVGPIGFMTAIGLYLVFVTLGVERMRRGPGLAAAVGTLLIVYLVFGRFLHVPFPKGPLGF